MVSMRFISAFMLLMLVLFYASSALARISGEFSLNHVGYWSEDSDSPDVDASHFAQRYTVMYEKQALIANGRAGHFDVGVGMQWAGFNTDIDNGIENRSFDRSEFKFLYKGLVDFAPGALPFRLRAYSQDLTEMNFDRSSRSVGARVIQPYIIDDLNNGQTIHTGLTLIAGIRNGSYLGEYRELLSKFPRLLIDYRDTYHRDTDSLNPMHYHDRNLAFISLNKKDNWFHYRLYDYKDYIDSSNDESTKSFLLGTIDHNYMRKWINLTNWINLSADGSVTIADKRSDSRKNESYNLNLFTTFSRPGKRVANFSNLHRLKRGERITSTLDVPTYVSYSVDPETTVRGRFLIYLEDDQFEDGLTEKEDMYYGNVKVETGSRQRISMSRGLEAELHTGDNGEGEAVRASFELYTNHKYRPSIDWAARTTIGVFSGDTPGTPAESDYVEGEFNGELSFPVDLRSRISFNQDVLVGVGSYDQSSLRSLTPKLSTGPSLSDAEETVPDDTVFRSETRAFYEHAHGRLQNSILLRYVYQNKYYRGNDPVRTFSSLKLSHVVSYKERAWSMKSETTFLYGDSTESSSLGDEDLNFGRLGEGNFKLFNKSRVAYKPSRYWENTLETFADYENFERGDRLFFSLQQKTKRNFFKNNGVVRKIMHVEQSFSYDYEDGISDETQQASFGLAVNYKPKRFLSLGTGMSYHYYSYKDYYMAWHASTTLSFPKFSVSFRYHYAQDEEQDALAHRYEVNVNKVF